MKILVSGASGYIGGRLVPVLLEQGHEVRCMTRNPDAISDDPWSPRVEIVKADAFDDDSLLEAMHGCDAAVYLIHSMAGAEGDFAQRDRDAAARFTAAADASSLKRIVYLGGLGDPAELSKHLASRQEVGRVLASGRTPVTELRAAVIIGSGSVSFEMLRYLTEVLPAMVTPRWVRTKCQPIAVGDVLKILAHALMDTGPDHQIHEIGGPDQLTYEEMMRVYASVAGLPKRWILPVPLLSPRLSSHWIGLVTPVPTRVAKPLVDSLRTEVVVFDNSYALRIVGELTGYEDSVGLALRRSRDLDVATRWSDAALQPAEALPSDPSWAGGTVYSNTRSVGTAATRKDLFWAFSRIGGSTGYYTMNWAWALRGAIDTIVGGVGLRRGRRHPSEIHTGESLDFWRVVHVEPGASLHLFAEMRLPGEAWLSFEAQSGESGSTLTQKALFIPRGLLGRLYWIALTPFHAVIFGRMAAMIVAAAEARSESGAA